MTVDGICICWHIYFGMCTCVKRVIPMGRRSWKAAVQVASRSYQVPLACTSLLIFAMLVAGASTIFSAILGHSVTRHDGHSHVPPFNFSRAILMEERPHAAVAAAAYVDLNLSALNASV